MEIKVLKHDPNTIFLELEKETITVTNLIREELWDEKNISEAASVKEHPYLEEPKIWLKTTRGSPIATLEQTCERILQEIQEFKQKFKEASKK